MDTAPLYNPEMDEPWLSEEERLWDAYHDACADERFDCYRLQALGSEDYQIDAAGPGEDW